MNTENQYTTFTGFTHVVTGDLKTMLIKTKEFLDNHPDTPVLIFNNLNGRQVDFNFHEPLAEILKKALPPEPGANRGPGRPRLGVVCGEVSLLPRHWDWLEQQPKRASGTIRALVEAAMKNITPGEQAKQRVNAAGNFMWSLAGNLPGFEEASRALYAGKWEVFEALIAPWPEDVRNHLSVLLEPVRGNHETGK